MNEIYKFICEECNHHDTSDKLLRAPNPFDAEEEIVGCPRCHGVNDKPTACDEPECWLEVCCGTPVKHGVSAGYRNTCSKHAPRESRLGKEYILRDGRIARIVENLANKIILTSPRDA